jgi:hypothetical protein
MAHANFAATFYAGLPHAVPFDWLAYYAKMERKGLAYNRYAHLPEADQPSTPWTLQGKRDKPETPEDAGQ